MDSELIFLALLSACMLLGAPLVLLKKIGQTQKNNDVLFLMGIGIITGLYLAIILIVISEYLYNL